MIITSLVRYSSAKAIALFCFFLLPLALFGQKYAVKFAADSVFVGRISKEQFPIVQRYEFKVVGQEPLTIKEVTADCACAVTKFTNRVIEPGNSGVVTVVFEPYQPGPFRKVFTVSFQETATTVDLILSGYINPFFPQPTLEYPYAFGSLRFGNKIIPLGTITNQGVVKKQLAVYNEGETPIAILDSMELPPHIALVFDASRTVPPKEILEFDLFFHPTIKNEFGFTEDTLVLYTDSQHSPQITLGVTASIKQYFPPSPHAAEDALPYLVVEQPPGSLGVLDLATPHLMSLTIINTGNAELVIQKIVPNYGCEVVSMESYKLEPYSSANLNLRLFDIGKYGKQDRSFTIFCNDPTQATKTIAVAFELRE